MIPVCEKVQNYRLVKSTEEEVSSRDLSHTKIGRSGLTYAVICLLVVPLSGCGGGAIPTPEPVTIVFAHSSFDAEYYEALVQEFNERYPHITVEIHPRRPPQQTSPDADVFVSSSFTLGELREQDDVLSLDPFIEQDASFDLPDFYPGTVRLFTSEGETWAIPAGVDVVVMFYNQDLFDQYGVPYPEIGWTWDDFLDRALALRDPDASVFGYAPTDRIVDSLSFIYQHGGRIFDDLQNPTRTTFDDPLTIEALEWYASLIHEHNVAPTQKQLYDEDLGGAGSVVIGVYMNKVGLWTGWFSERGGGRRASDTWPGEWKMRWGAVPLPSDAQSATLTSVEGYFISSQAQHPDACWQWISFLSEQMSSDVQHPRRLMPARKSLAESTAYEQQVGSDVAAVARVSMESAMVPSPRLVELGGVWGIFWRALDAITNGRSTPEEAMISAQQEAERIYP
jgi:multiple sugar transport system substrate-binding protein